SIKYLQAEKNKYNSSEQSLKLEIETNYTAGCFDFYQKLERGYNLTFFLDENGFMKEPEISRAAMVFGYKNRIGVRQDQIDVIKKILDNPNCLEELRMGLGKSFVISPMIAKLMSKRGVLPVVLFTEQLIDLSKKDMAYDAYEFHFQRSPDLSFDELTHLYKTLLEIKVSGRYIITTASRLAALQNKFHELQDSIESKLIEFERAKESSKDSLPVLGAQLAELKNQARMLQKINTVFSPEPHQTRLFVDEVDEIFKISKEINYATGGKKSISKESWDISKSIFSYIFSEEDQKSDLFRLKQSIQKNSQASLSEEILDEALKELSLKISRDIIVDNPSVNQQNLEAFLLDKSKEADASINDLSQSTKTQIGAARTWIQDTLPNILKKQGGIDYGIGEDKYTIVPRQQGTIKKSTMFGDETELVGYHLLAYLQEFPENQEFFTTMMKSIYSKNADFLTELRIEDFSSEQMKGGLDEIKKPENWEKRIQFLEYILRDNPQISMDQEVIPLLAHDIAYSKNVAGVSGTTNPDALPSNLTQNQQGNARPSDVLGETLMLMQKTSHKLDSAVSVYTSDHIKEHIKTLFEDETNTAVINIGESFPGNNEAFIRNVLKSMQKNRCIIYLDIDPITQEKKTYWLDKPTSKATLFEKDRKDPEYTEKFKTALYYFSPSDTRGTDFQIPPGSGVVIPG
ncbi:MAG: DUF3638 domain-containing protein, partial [Chlamydiae bacterium]|nr:DUF3638 domain-containing protein [Chlamydiota bacterium]